MLLCFHVSIMTIFSEIWYEGFFKPKWGGFINSIISAFTFIIFPACHNFKNMYFALFIIIIFYQI